MKKIAVATALSLASTLSFATETSQLDVSLDILQKTVVAFDSDTAGWTDADVGAQFTSSFCWYSNASAAAPTVTLASANSFQLKNGSNVGGNYKIVLNDVDHATNGDLTLSTDNESATADCTSSTERETMTFSLEGIDAAATADVSYTDTITLTISAT